MATKITQRVESEIHRLALEHRYDESVLRDFALFVLQKKLPLPQLKQAIYQHFQVKNTPALKKSGAFQMATTGMGKLDLSKKVGWEKLYRKLIGVLPGEESETGYGRVNGVDIFKYDLPWKAFGLDPKTATTENIKSAYRELSKVYHPDNRKTGDTRIFDRLTVFYKSLTERF